MLLSLWGLYFLLLMDLKKIIYIYVEYLFILSVPCRILVPQLEIEPVPPTLGMWSLNPWTTREVPTHGLKKLEEHVEALCSPLNSEDWDFEAQRSK